MNGFRDFWHNSHNRKVAAIVLGAVVVSIFLAWLTNWIWPPLD
jgi:hypothetical protein